MPDIPPATRSLTKLSLTGTGAGECTDTPGVCPLLMRSVAGDDAIGIRTWDKYEISTINLQPSLYDNTCQFHKRIRQVQNVVSPYRKLFFADGPELRHIRLLKWLQ